jgi:hypothetical protein
MLMLFICTNKMMEQKIKKRKLAVLNEYVSVLRILQTPLKPIIAETEIE